MRNILVPVLLLAGMLAAGAPLPRELTQGSPESLAAAGLRFRVFRNMKPMPLPMPAFRAVRNDNTKLIDNLEYWRFRQTAGIWSNSLSLIRVGTVTLAPPGKRELLPESEAAATFKTLDDKLPEAQERQWVEDFTGAKVTAVKPYQEALFGATAKVFELEQTEAYQTAYLISSKLEPTRQILLFFAIERKEFDERVETTIRQTLSSFQFVTPRRTVESQGESVRKKGTPEYEANREQVLRSIRNLRDWRFEESDNYIFVTNDSDRRAISRLRSELEQAREVFTDYFPLRKPLQAVSVVRIFNTRDQYKEYVGEALQWSGGLWMPARRELVISPLDRGARESVRQMFMRQVAFHEGFHQYLHYAAGEAQAGMWFNEGTAQFFEGVEFQSGKGIVKLPQYIESTLTALFAGNKVHDIAALIKMDRDTFYGQNRDVNYPLAQALVYYLWKGAPTDGKPEYAQIPIRYYDTLLETGSAAEANAAAFKGIDLEQLSKDLSRFWNSSNLIRQSIRYQPDPRKTADGKP